MKTLALVITFCLLGGGTVATVATVGNVDWDAWLEDGTHYERIKYTTAADVFSIINTEPEYNSEDHLYYAVTKLEIKGQEGSLVYFPDYVKGITQLQLASGLLIQDYIGSSLLDPEEMFIPGAYVEKMKLKTFIDVTDSSVKKSLCEKYKLPMDSKFTTKFYRDTLTTGTVTLYDQTGKAIDENYQFTEKDVVVLAIKLSDSHILEIQHVAPDMRSCIESIYDAEDVLNDLMFSKAIRIVDSVEPAYFKMVDYIWEQTEYKRNNNGNQTNRYGESCSITTISPLPENDGLYHSYLSLTIPNRAGSIILVPDFNQTVDASEVDGGVLLIDRCQAEKGVINQLYLADGKIERIKTTMYESEQSHSVHALYGVSDDVNLRLEHQKMVDSSIHLILKTEDGTIIDDDYHPRMVEVVVDAIVLSNGNRLDLSFTADSVNNCNELMEPAKRLLYNTFSSTVMRVVDSYSLTGEDVRYGNIDAGNNQNDSGNNNNSNNNISHNRYGIEYTFERGTTTIGDDGRYSTSCSFEVLNTDGQMILIPSINKAIDCHEVDGGLMIINSDNYVDGLTGEMFLPGATLKRVTVTTFHDPSMNSRDEVCQKYGLSSSDGIDVRCIESQDGTYSVVLMQGDTVIDNNFKPTFKEVVVEAIVLSESSIFQFTVSGSTVQDNLESMESAIRVLKVCIHSNTIRLVDSVRITPDAELSREYLDSNHHNSDNNHSDNNSKTSMNRYAEQFTITYENDNNGSKTTFTIQDKQGSMIFFPTYHKNLSYSEVDGGVIITYTNDGSENKLYLPGAKVERMTFTTYVDIVMDGRDRTSLCEQYGLPKDSKIEVRCSNTSGSWKTLLYLNNTVIDENYQPPVAEYVADVILLSNNNTLVIRYSDDLLSKASYSKESVERLLLDLMSSCSIRMVDSYKVTPDAALSYIDGQKERVGKLAIQYSLVNGNDAEGSKTTLTVDKNGRMILFPLHHKELSLDEVDGGVVISSDSEGVVNKLFIPGATVQRMTVTTYEDISRDSNASSQLSAKYGLPEDSHLNLKNLNISGTWKVYLCNGDRLIDENYEPELKQYVVDTIVLSNTNELTIRYSSELMNAANTQESVNYVLSQMMESGVIRIVDSYSITPDAELTENENQHTEDQHPEDQHQSDHKNYTATFYGVRYAVTHSDPELKDDGYYHITSSLELKNKEGWLVIGEDVKDRYSCNEVEGGIMITDEGGFQLFLEGAVFRNITITTIGFESEYPGFNAELCSKYGLPNGTSFEINHYSENNVDYLLLKTSDGTIIDQDFHYPPLVKNITGIVLSDSGVYEFHHADLSSSGGIDTADHIIKQMMNTLIIRIATSISY